ncbi:lymphatic vessel endothelial hyaluronic acid receptor 1-like isoform X4 [Polypterus senegalus]|uniref:lymphatic vessel endothelial hyaluronic acid receptor 1-like isoform X4 n=1 Tax=Polypterus senegalus TaxID=55291 RepID=UPI001964F7E3|nr:lymphatic vessel endothelial hyaluronic acid receptor 1-like isoform X4 [Polypterus senegalus]
MSWTSVLLLLLLLSPITGGYTPTSDDLKDVIMGCSYMGVFHVERGQYQLTYDQADGLCQALGVVLANEEQLKVAHQNNFQTCRYGWIDNETVLITQLDSKKVCLPGKIGSFIITNKTEKYDAFCFNATETKPINCATRTLVPTSPEPWTVATDGGQTSGFTDWLIISAVIVAVLIFSFVCIAIVQKQRHNRKRQKLVISGQPTEGNQEGTAQKERDQEMVLLMNQQKIMENGGTNEDSTVIILDEQVDQV